jgi:two-component system LytT family response regulator
MTPTMIRTLVVDDQPLARQRLVALLGDERDVELVGECADGRAAVEAVRRIGPDLVFLDLQMPELDGFGVVEAVGVDRMPVVVFVTAYDEHALRAFEIHAVDYLLKPFSNDRFRSALSHARRQLQRQRAEEFSERLLQLMRTASPRLADLVDEPSPRMMIKAEGRVAFVSPDDINWVEAEGNYARLYLDAGSHVLRETMKGLEARMGDRFVRIHRCHAINIYRLHELRTVGGGEFEAVLKDGTALRVGQSYREKLEERLKRMP